MNRVLVCCVAACLIVLMIKPVKSMSGEEVVGKIPEAYIYLYATEREGNLEKFRLEANGAIQYFPFWINVSNESYWPQLIYSDINHDGEKELIIILTKGYGTGTILQEVHVLHNTETNIGNVYREMIVDNPMAILLKNVKTKLTKSVATITIGNEKTVIKIDKLRIEPKNLFSDVVTDNLIRFEVIDNKLMAIVGAQIAPAGGYIGSFHLTYEFQNGLYECRKIEFVHSD
ncbi:hypothetical protein NSQ43_10880 [Sporosarcina sp. FSL W8-0480]|uniref:hypothetical protein n=1 Tax=Sporosarcina sp. FSL W8-0480 TaxID=2954701 RepID=UPI0030D73EA0